MIEYLCPGCLFNDKQSILIDNKILTCSECIKNNNFFANHSKSGSRCEKCNRFIPQPLDYKDNINCPYNDCDFIGKFSSLNRMNHPTVTSNHICIKKIDSLQIKKIFNIIHDLKSLVIYNSLSFTQFHKVSIFEAIELILLQNPNEFIPFLLNKSKYGFHHKIFQEYISILENKLPLNFTKNNNFYNIKSIFDTNLNIFDGISEFDSIVNENNEIDNSAEEYYIGGRKATYSKPYFFGKILDIKINDISIIKDISCFNFSKITLNAHTGAHIHVSHLRIKPHYSLGSLGKISLILDQIKNEAKARNI